MHDRLTPIGEIAEMLADSPLAKSGEITADDLTMDAGLIELLLEEKSRLEILKECCADKSFESRRYNELLMATAEIIAEIRQFEIKYRRSLVRT